MSAESLEKEAYTFSIQNACLQVSEKCDMHIASIPRISPRGDQKDWKTTGKGIILSLFGFLELTVDPHVGVSGSERRPALFSRHPQGWRFAKLQLITPRTLTLVVF